MAPNAAPMMTPIARSTTFPFTAKSRNSLSTDNGGPPLCCHSLASPTLPAAHANQRFAMRRRITQIAAESNGPT